MKGRSTRTESKKMESFSFFFLFSSFFFLFWGVNLNGHLFPFHSFIRRLSAGDSEIPGFGRHSHVVVAFFSVF